MPLYHILFNFSEGLKETIRVPKGTIEELKAWIEEVTEKLGLEVTQYLDNPKHWANYEPDKSIANDIASDYVERHNNKVMRFYFDLQNWAENPESDYEELTPEIAETFWYGLQTLRLPFHRWSRDYYVSEMKHLFDVMTNGHSKEVTWDTKKLTLKQAASVIHLFADYLDYHDVRLELPYKQSFLVTGDKYYWCPTHGAIFNEDVVEKSNGKIYCPVSRCKGLADYND